ncbi:MAG TPA: substrate-binding domain-containing protein [Thermoanaerobaculia bacterium]|jgi:ABC-type phosphate transport system substrate-binding protein|nr:substrate-binding domain-containing protein [Thermoanaerobaculia bacterium]
MSFWNPRLGALALLLALAGFGLVARRSVAADPFVVIVNAANPVSSITVQDLSKAFMKKATRWPDGVEILPVDLKEQSAVRESFSRLIHEKSTSAVRAYWQKMIFSGREVPPPEKATSAEVLAFVRSNRGAVGYLAAEAALGDGVKVVRVTR